jgi:hypothetical protein
MERTQQLENHRFGDNEVPKELLGKKLNENDIERLKNGSWSNLLENAEFNDGVKRDIKIRLVRDEKDGSVKIQFKFKQEELDIPSKIGNYELEDEEKKLLETGKTIGPVKAFNDNDIYIKIDKELNQVMVFTDKDFGIPKQIGEYELNKTDKELLSNGESLPTKVYKGEQGYFLANIELIEDENGRKGIKYSNIKSISPEMALELKEKYNKETLKEPKIENKGRLEAEKQKKEKTQEEEKGVNNEKIARTAKEMITTSFNNM